MGWPERIRRRLLVLFLWALLLPPASSGTVGDPEVPGPPAVSEEKSGGREAAAAEIPESREDEEFLITAPAEETPAPGPGQETVITREQIEASGASTLAEAVKGVPGLTVVRQGGLTDPALVSIRGSAENQVLILLDGRPLNDLSGGAVDLSAVPLDRVESIRVIRGGSGAWYGDGAFGGVILITTLRQGAPAASFAVEYGYGSFGTHRGSVRGSLPLNGGGTMGLELGAGGFVTSGEWAYESSQGETLRLNNGGGAFSLSSGFYREGANQDSLRFQGEAFGSLRGSPGLMEFLTPRAEKEESRYGGSLSWESPEGDSGWLFLEAAAQDRYSAYRNPDDGTDQEHRNRQVLLRSTWTDFRPEALPLLRGEAGISWASRVLDSTALTDSAGTALQGRGYQHEGALWIRPGMILGEAELVPALRYDLFLQEYMGTESRFRGVFSWSLAGSWVPVRESPERPAFSLSGSVSSVFRNPSFEDLFWSGGAFASGNPDLLPEEGINADAGAAAELSPAGGRIRVEGIYFFNRLKNLIQWLPGAGGIWRPSNVGLAVIQGAEFSLDGLFPLGALYFLEFRGGYTWMSCRDADPGSVNYRLQLAYRPEHQASLSFTLKGPAGSSLELGGNWLGYRFTTNADTKYLDPVFTLDGSFRFSPEGSWYAAVTGRNLTGRQYVDRLGYPVPGLEWSIKGGMEL